ncbi:hypothetical protein TNIN_421581 [Trichonephila inaurata madagascariensis]|uniref:Uncharacterized protein n=1 Tax=Trichonephila inaurata madagascariensis TaxID=2747483 RepID=A0A8X6Y5S7_9ARAC|nr:hypothetical protein TNIN_421581 [Trichonephila inaurata madagascariensis]
MRSVQPLLFEEGWVQVVRNSLYSQHLFQAVRGRDWNWPHRYQYGFIVSAFLPRSTISVSDDALLPSFSGDITDGNDLRPSGVVTNACQKEGEAKCQMVEMVQLVDMDVLKSLNEFGAKGCMGLTVCLCIFGVVTLSCPFSNVLQYGWPDDGLG